MVKGAMVERPDILEEPRSDRRKARCHLKAPSQHWEQLSKEPEQLTGSLCDSPICWKLTTNEEHTSCRSDCGAGGGTVNSCRIQIPALPLSSQGLGTVSERALAVCPPLTAFPG